MKTEFNDAFCFDDETIRGLFGFEDAESEPINRLKEYYLKKQTFASVTSDSPLKILVGHKGTGKSALFKVAISEEQEKGNLPIMIRPDDIAELGKKDDNFLLKIKQWKYGLTKIIGEKVLNEFNLNDESNSQKLSQFGLKLLSYITDTVVKARDNIDLSETQRRLVANFLERKKIVVYIDDLDRGWEGKKDDILRISALLNSVRDMANDNPGLLFKVSLRSDVYYLVRTSDESTDKIEGTVVWCRWTNHEVLVLLVKRVLTFFNKEFNEDYLKNTDQHTLSEYLNDILEHEFYGQGKWGKIPTYKVLMSLVRKRPRDIVKLCTLAARVAGENGHKKINSEDLKSVFEEYSQGRIQDTINEYRSELPNIKNLIFGMRPTKKERSEYGGYIYTGPQLRTKLSKILQNTSLVFTNGRSATPAELEQFLYKINFLTARKVLDDGSIQRKYFEENRYLSQVPVFGYNWEVHPAFRWALQPEGVESILSLFTTSC